MHKLEDNSVVVIFDFQYTTKDGRHITVKQGEKLYLINKTNRDWWQVIRSCEERPFFVPAEYVKEAKQRELVEFENKESKDCEIAEYQNLDFLKKEDKKIHSKPVPKARTLVQATKQGSDELTDKKHDNDSDSSFGSDRIDNRMRNSYNLKPTRNLQECSKIERKQSVPSYRRKPLQMTRDLSKSLEKLAQEIKFEPKFRVADNGSMSSSDSKENSKQAISNSSPESTRKSEKEAMNLQHKAANNEKTEDKRFFRASLRAKSKDVDHILAEKVQNVEQKRPSMRGRTSDASVVLNEKKALSKSRGLFSSFKRKKQAFVLSSSWEGLDKIAEIAEKPMVTAFGLQRSKTFMSPEKPKPRTRLDAYNDKVWTFSTFKPQEVSKRPEVTKPTTHPLLPGNTASDGEGDLKGKDSTLPANQRQSSVESVLSSAGGESDSGKRPMVAPFSARKASLVRNRRVDSSKIRLRMLPTPPPDESPLRELWDGWAEYCAPDGRPYFYNRQSGERNLKPPRKAHNLQFGGSKDSIASDLSSPIQSSPSPSPKFSSGTSLDRLTPERPARLSLDRLTPIDIPPLAAEEQTTPLSSPTYLSPLDNPPSDGEGLELSDHVRLLDVVPDGWVETFEKTKPGERSRRAFVHVKTKQKWYAAHDDEDRVYFYHENSNVSRWKLPDLPDPPKDGVGSSHVGEMHSIQRSATETLIPTDSLDTRQRRTTEKDAKSRATKTQSMILDAKVDISRENSKSGSMVRVCLHPDLVDFRRSGLLHRAKILDNGKRFRKNWVSTFTVLCKSHIFFFKDEKTFLQMQKVGSVPNGSYVAHNLEGSVIEVGGKISGRKNVYKITWPQTETEILIQADKKTDADEWVSAIQGVIDSIPNTRNASSGSLESSPLLKVTRSKSIKAKIKGSIEDLSAATSGDSKNKISELLKKFILRRPSSDSLRQKGILRDEPVFGRSLEQITQSRNPRVPEFVERCVEVIESREENMKTDGLYRASGNLSQVQKIRLDVDQNKLSVLEHEEDVHVLTGSLKLFFRELREPLIPFPLFERALEASRNKNEKQKIKELKKTMESLPIPNRDTLKFLLEHLLRVQALQEFNRMTISNLAIVFGPTLMWPAPDSPNMALDLMEQNLVIETLLKEFKSIFQP